MPVDNNALRTVEKSKAEMVLFKDEKIIPDAMYEVVCEEDYVYPLGGQVYFKAGVPTKINGLFAKQIVKYTRGKVQFVDKSILSTRVAEDTRDSEIAANNAEIAELKAMVEKLTSSTKPTKKDEEVVSEVVEEKPKTVKKAAKKAEE